MPSHDTFSRLSRLLDPAAFSTCLTRSAAGLSEASGDGPVALDGKGLRCCALAKVRSTSPVALVNAFASASGLALGLVGVPRGQASQVRPASTADSRNSRFHHRGVSRSFGTSAFLR